MFDRNNGKGKSAVCDIVVQAEQVSEKKIILTQRRLIAVSHNRGQALDIVCGMVDGGDERRLQWMNRISS